MRNSQLDSAQGGSFRTESSEPALGPGKVSQRGWAFLEEGTGLEGERMGKETQDSSTCQSKEAEIWGPLGYVIAGSSGN